MQDSMQALRHTSVHDSVHALPHALVRDSAQALPHAMVQDGAAAGKAVPGSAPARADTAISRQVGAQPWPGRSTGRCRGSGDKGRRGAQSRAGSSRMGVRDGEGSVLTAAHLPSSSDEALWCRTTRALREDEAVCAFVVAEPPAIANHHAVKAEPGESPYPAALHSDIQLLPQQAGMAAILATAVVNSESPGTGGHGSGGTVHPTGPGSCQGSPAHHASDVCAILVPSPPQRMSSRARTAGSGTGASATCKPT